MTAKIMDRMRRRAVLAAGAGLLAIPACATEEIGPPPQVYVSTTSGPDQGAFIAIIAPGAPTYEAWLASGSVAQYALAVDGAQLVQNIGGSPQPIVIGEGSEDGVGYLPAGHHLLAVAEPGRSAPLFVVDADIVAGAQNVLYLFGPRDAVAGRFLSYPTQPAPGTMHVSAISLIQDGPTVEVVSCPQGAACTSLSPPLALGDAFETDLTALTVGKWPYYTLQGDATLGLREVPTAALSTPPVYQLSAGYSLTTPASGPDPPANMLIAPSYIGADGTFLTLYE